MHISKKITMGLLCVALLSGCVQRAPTSTRDMNYQEDILLKAKTITA